MRSGLQVAISEWTMFWFKIYLVDELESECTMDEWDEWFATSVGAEKEELEWIVFGFKKYWVEEDDSEILWVGNKSDLWWDSVEGKVSGGEDSVISAATI